MIKIFRKCVLWIFLLSACTSTGQSATASPSGISDHPGAYLGQTLPGAAPLPFGENFFSGSFHSAPVFSPDGNIVWWAGAYQSAKIYTSTFQEGAWTKPAAVQFSEEINTYRDPFIAPDGSKFYFISTEPVPGISDGGKESIWMMEKQGQSWGTPQPLPESINSLTLHWTISVSNTYNLYFSAEENGQTGIYVARYENGAYQDPHPLDVPVNSEFIEITPNIAPDESYLLFSRIADYNSTPYLYISFATETGWTEPAKVENVPYCISPIVTPDRRYVIYLSSASSFAWRDTSFIEEFRP